jgi:hypothetical protein
MTILRSQILILLSVLCSLSSAQLTVSSGFNFGGSALFANGTRYDQLNPNKYVTSADIYVGLGYCLNDRLALKGAFGLTQLEGLLWYYEDEPDIAGPNKYSHNRSLRWHTTSISIPLGIHIKKEFFVMGLFIQHNLAFRTRRQDSEWGNIAGAGYIQDRRYTLRGHSLLDIGPRIELGVYLRNDFKLKASFYQGLLNQQKKNWGLGSWKYNQITLGIEFALHKFE